MKVEEVRIEEALRGSRTTNDAGIILRAFVHRGSCQKRGELDPRFVDRFFFAEGGCRPGILAVGYAGDVATSAAVFIEETKTPTEYDDSSDVPHIGLPYIGITLIATDPEYRNRGYGTKIVETILSLASNAGYARVQAMWPAGDEARRFWRNRGFEKVPFLTFGCDMARSTDRSLQQATRLNVAIKPEINERLAFFVAEQQANADLLS